MRRLLLICLCLVAATAARGDPTGITTRDAFWSLVAGRDLTRLGVTLTLTPDGAISGRVLGRKVSGRWEWKGPNFCRDFMGEGLLGYDCQTVEMRGDALRTRVEFLVGGDGQGRTPKKGVDRVRVVRYSG